MTSQEAAVLTDGEGAGGVEDLGELEGAEGDVGTLPVEGEDHLQEKRATLHWFVVQLDSAIFQFNSCRFLLTVTPLRIPDRNGNVQNVKTVGLRSSVIALLSAVSG